MASIKPETSKGHDLGTSDKKWGTVHTGDLRTETIVTSGDVLIAGTLTVTGSNIVASVETIEAKDPLISLAKDNTADTFDIGFYGKSVSGGNSKYHGIVRDADDSGKFKVFKDASGEPTTTVGTHSVATVVADLEVPVGNELNLPMSNGALADYVTAVTLGSVKASKVLTVDANKDLDGLRHLTMTGTLTAGNVTIAGSAISTSDGSAPSFDNVAITGGSVDGVTIGGTTAGPVTATTLIATGNVNLGDADTDTLTITAKVDSNVIPTGTVSLGTLSAKWSEAHATTVNAVTLSATGNVDLGTDFNNTITVNASVDSDIVPDGDATRSLGSSSKRWSHVHSDNVTANSLTAGRVVFAGTNGKLVDDLSFTFSGATLTATNISSTAATVTNFSSGNVTISGGSIDGVDINTSDITVPSGKTLDVSDGALTTSEAQNLYILEHANSDVDFGSHTVTATTFIGQISSLSTHSTDNLSEGSTNLYYTDERVDDRVGALLQEGQAIGLTYVDNDTESSEGAGSLTIAVDTASASTLGVASFTLSDFAVTSGEVSIKAGGVSNDQLAGSIANDKLSNSSMGIAGQTVALGAQITAASIAAAIDSENMALTAVTDLDGAAGSLTIFDNLNSAGTLTIGHLDGVIATPADLSITGTMLQNVDLANGKEYRIENSSGTAVSVLTATTLGNGVVDSSLTKVGALDSGSIVDGFGQISTSSTISTSGNIVLSSDSSALVLGENSDAKIIFDGTDLQYRTGGSTGGAAKHSFQSATEDQIMTLESSSGAGILNMPSNSELQINSTKIIDSTSLGSQVVGSSLTSVGALDSGSITSNFGSINVGNSQIQTSGTISAGFVSIDNLRLNGSTIGHSSNLDLMTLSSGTLSIAGRLDATTLAISSVDITSTATEINILDADQTSVGTTAVADGHGLVMQQAGVTTLTSVETLAAYLDNEITNMPNLVSAASLATLGIVTTGSWQATDVAVAHGGTGASDAETARGNLGLGIGSDVQAYSDILTEFATTASTIANEIADLVEGEIAVLDRNQSNGTAEANKVLVLDADSSITSGLSTLTASTITTGNGASLNGGNLTASAVATPELYAASGDLTLSAGSGSDVIVSSNLVAQAKITGGASGIEFEGTMKYDLGNHVVATSSNVTLPSASQGLEMIYINTNTSDITVSITGNDVIYESGQSFSSTSVTLAAKQTLRLIAINATDWYQV